MSTRKVIVGTNASLGGPATTATIDSSNNPANSIVNNLNVKITPSSENLLKKPESEQEVEYEAVKYQGMDDVTVVKPKTREIFTSEDDHDLLVYLVNIFHNIISSDYKSVLNLVDKSGLIVLDVQALIGVISRICAIDESCVRIEIEDVVDVGCCGMVKSKFIPLEPIHSIKIDLGNGFVDFNLTRNDLYNKIQDTYKISLEKCYENSYIEQLLKK